MPNYWLHVNHPTNKALIHVENGCKRAREAIARKRAGKPYGSVLGNRNGYWDGPFPTLKAAQKVQKATGKSITDYCRVCPQ